MTLLPVTLYDGSTSAPMETTTYDGEGNVAATTDASGATTTSSYDPLGRQVSTTDPVAGTSTTSYNATERVSSTDADGHVSQLRYDGAGRLAQASDPLTGTVQYQYDAVGNTVAITSGDSSGAILGTETRGYDARNRVQSDTVGGPGVPALVTTTWYDADGNVVQVVAPAGDAALTTYDLAGETLTTEDDPRVNAGPLPALQTSYGYDGAGNQVTRQDPDGRATSTVYDGDNRVTQSVALTGTSTVATTLGYDPNGNTVAQTVQTTDSAHPGQPQVSTYNASYDAADQQMSETTDGLTTVYGYDATGQRRTESLPTGGSVTRVTDAGGRVTEIDEAAPGAGPYSSVYRNYDNVTGQARSFQLGDGVAGQRSFDGANRPTSVGYYNISDPNPYTALTYDTAGRVNSTTTLSGTDLLGYDGANRLISESGPQLLVKSGARWTYDGNGNLLTATDDTGATDLYTYSTTIRDELTAMGATGDPITKTTAYSYDGSGNVTSIANTASPTDKNALVQHLSYDGQGRINQVTYLDHSNGNTTTTISIAYNAEGQRSDYAIAPQGQSIVDMRFTYRDGHLAQQQVISNTAGVLVVLYTNTYLYGPNGEPLELIHTQPGQPTGRYWYETDSQGSVITLTDSHGNVVDHYTYDSWGESTSDDRTNEHVPQQLRYKGAYYDEKLTWYWLGGRYYDPETERYLQPDANRGYVYNGDDPSDLSNSGDVAGKVFGTVGGIAPQAEPCEEEECAPDGGGGGITESGVVAPKAYDRLLFQTWAFVANKFPVRGTAPDNQYQIRVAGALEYELRGGGEKIRADEVDLSDGYLVDAKYVANADRSPFVLNSRLPDRIRHLIIFKPTGIANEIQRYGDVIHDPITPARGLEIITNEPRAVAFFLDAMRAFHIPGRVVVRR